MDRYAQLVGNVVGALGLLLVVASVVLVPHHLAFAGAPPPCFGPADCGSKDCLRLPCVTTVDNCQQITKAGMCAGCECILDSGGAGCECH